jgi:hypothetical protein
MIIDKRTFPWIILTALILGTFIAFLLGFQPVHIGGNPRDGGGHRNNVYGPVVVFQIEK